MFHSTGIIPDYDLACARLEALAGLRVLEYSENTQPEIGRRGGMTWLGDNSIELGQPIIEGGGAARFVARTGGGMHSVAVQVTDLEATMAHLESCGVGIAARPMPEFCFTNPRDTHGVLFQWAVFEMEEDPHFGAVPAPMTFEPAVDVAQQAFVGAVVEDPSASARLFADLLSTEVTFEDPDAGAGEPYAGVSLGDCSLALFPMPSADSERLWGQSHEFPRTHLVALTVPELDDVDEALAEHSFAVWRRSPTMVVLDPATTGGIQVALVDSLLEGDPRSGR